jgi:hypothetical protein
MATDQGTEAQATDAPARTPPYISFATLLTFLKALKADGVPPQIDKSVLSKLSGGVQGQMKMALRSLGLMGDGDKPTDHLELLVEAFDTDDFGPLLRERLQATYPYVFALDLMTATSTMFSDSFKVTGAKEDVLRKCRTSGAGIRPLERRGGESFQIREAVRAQLQHHSLGGDW